ncbi:MAG: 50S ribosomal protein L29 [Patescibacteria group bacterium]|nr:50S ribosomal protein L29 [Patescibacteria group bacterium]
MKFKELKIKSKEELSGILTKNRDKIRDLRFKTANNQLKNVKEIKKLKRQIAQILTIDN